jgi:TonB-linked SusC/RagA family outer membrane protein
MVLQPSAGDKTQYSVSARVVTDNGVLLPGVSIREKGTGNTVISAQDGSFRLLVASAESIVLFSNVGYAPREYVAHAVPEQVILLSEDNTLEQVVITGYQKLDKSRFTGSVSQIDKTHIDRAGYVDVSRLLQGAAAGVSVQNVSGTFGATPKIRIRGNASISANQEPLYVLNGVPITSPANVNVNQLYSGDPASLLGSAIAGLNAQDIEDITILKDGAATSLYGTRAANGVVSIRTKSGQKNNRSINFSTALTLGIKPTIRNYNVLNSAQETDFYKELYDRGYFSNENWPLTTGAYTDAYRRYALREINQEQAYSELDRSATANTDWFDVLFRNNVLQEHSLSFSGGKDRYTYYLSGSYTKDDGQAIGYGMDRGTLDARSQIDLTKRLKVDVLANWNKRGQRAPGTHDSGTRYANVARDFEINPAIYAMSSSRSMYLFQSDGSYKYYLNNYAPFNIVEELRENYSDIDVQEWRMQVQPSYQILSNLRYEVMLAARLGTSGHRHVVTERSNVARAYRVDYNDVLREENPLLYKDPTDPYAYFETILPEGGFLYSNRYKSKSYTMRHALTFDENWGQHAVYSTVGFDFNKDRTDRTYRKDIGYLHEQGGEVRTSDLALLQASQNDELLYEETFTNQNLLGYYFSGQYAYRQRYNVELGGRLDASNMFGRLARSKFLPNYSVGLSWNVDRESFMRSWVESGVVQQFKLRGSYALRGNAYQTSPTRNARVFNAVRLDNENSEQVIDILSPELFNLNWEKDYISNIGIDLSLWNKLSLTAEYYTRKNKDLISRSNIAQEEGFSTKVINFASMENRGFDINIGFRDVLASDKWSWHVNLLYGYVRNKVIGGELQSSLLTQVTRSTGYPLDGYPLEGLYAYNYQSLDADGRPVFSYFGRPTQGITSAETNRGLIQYAGSRQPLGTGSVSSSLSYKGFEFRFLLTGAHGHKVFMSPIAARYYADNQATPGEMGYRWIGPGDEHTTDIPGLLSTYQRMYLATSSAIDEVAYNRSTIRVADASVLRLSEIMIAYDVQPAYLSKLKGIKRARVSLSGNNVAYWASKRLKGMDPELLLTGVALPNPVSYSLRLTAGF